MRKRWKYQMHPVTAPIIIIGYIFAAIWVLWVTVVAFLGGTIPVLGWEVKGGFIWGVLSVACLWPIASFIYFALSQALDEFAWRLDDKYHDSPNSNDLNHPS